MKLAKNFLLLIVLATTFSAFAAKSSNIQLGGGTVAPKESLTIPLDKLMSGGSYYVHCQIADVNNDKNKVMMLFNVVYSLTGVTLNGKYIFGTPAQARLNKTNTVVIGEVGARNGAVIFGNMDQDDSVEVSNCVAIPTENSKIN